VAYSLTGIFVLYEVLQLIVQKLDYFKDFINWIDLTRFALIIYCIYDINNPLTDNFKDVYAIMFVLVWFKLIKYLQVFDATRYLTRMMFDVVADLGTFILILLLVILAYAQITISIEDSGDAKTFDELSRQAYVLAFGDFGGFDTFTFVKFMVFVIFSFVVPLVMMNLLIAIISDSYAVITSNQVSTNSRSLAEMLLEMEQLVNLFRRIFSPNSIKN
jgi:hypothetical protein